MSRIGRALAVTVVLLAAGSAPAFASSISVDPPSGPGGTVITVSGVCDQPGFDEGAAIGFSISRSGLGQIIVPPPVNVPWAVTFQVPIDPPFIGPPRVITITGSCGGPAGTEMLPTIYFDITDGPVPEPVAASPDFTG